MMNKSNGNMYDWCSHTWNPVRGCKHECSYCYVNTLMKRYGYSTEPRFVEKEMLTKLGVDNVIFVCSTADLFGEWVPKEWIDMVLEHCKKFDNKYLFQTKNPARFIPFLDSFPEKTILGTTLETNRDYNVSKAPSVRERFEAMKKMELFPKMISVEPVLDFDVDEFSSWIIELKPYFVSIGADSKGHGLPEPTSDKVAELVEKLEAGGIPSILKYNIGRLFDGNGKKCDDVGGQQGVAKDSTGEQR